LLGLQEQQVLKELLVLRVQRDLKGLLDLQEQQVRKELLVLRAQRDHKALPVLQVHKESLEQMAIPY
jgi:hypothetical protein